MAPAGAGCYNRAVEQALWQLIGRHDEIALGACDSEGRLVFATPALERLLGLEPDTMRGRRVDSWVLEDPEAAHHLAYDDYPLIRALAGETVRNQIISTTRPDGRTVHLRCSASAVEDEHGERHALVLAQDVTADMVALLQHEALRVRLVDTLNHELRTPLTKILGHAEILEDAAREQPLPRTVLTSIDAIIRATRDLARLAGRLSHLADLDALSRPAPVAIDARDVVTTVVHEGQERARTRGVALHLHAPDALTATVDPGSLHRSVAELVTNGVDHSPPGAAVVVSLQTCREHLEVVVADRGPGIPAHERKRLVEPFERGEHADPAASSTGLGLAVAAAIAVAHGGGLVLEDNDPCGLVARLALRREPA